MYPEPLQQLTYQTEDTVYFFSHAYDPLNNWSAHAVEIWGHVFPTVEHGFQWKKFADHEPDIASAILRAPSPWAVVQLKKTIGDGKMPADWHNRRADIMEELLRAKVAQHEDVQISLRQTGSRTIVENSPVASYWSRNPDGNGDNMMGKLWMQIRDELLGVLPSDR